MTPLSNVNLYAAKRAGMRWGRKLLDECGRELCLRSRLGDRPVFDAADFRWAKELEAEWRAMRAELEAVLRTRERVPCFQDVSPDQAHLTQGDQWKTFFFWAYGYRADENCARCPATARLLERIPGMTTAFFSILGPRTHVRAHRGVYKGVLRYHLGLMVPAPSLCRIRVADQLLHWREGESLVFDDTYEHEVWNDSDQDRVVLFVDVLRPLPWPWTLGNEMFIKAIGLTPLVQDGLANLARWNSQGRDEGAFRH
jgi:ornithine lipid ester-linked acyl 2-hydroxylase